VIALQENLPLSPWTTFGVGGPARYFLNAASEQDVVDGLDFAKSRHLPVFVLGGGSNLLVADSGFPGLVLRVGIKGQLWQGDELCAAAGEDWDGLVAACVERGLAGVECLSGIPGLAGGTPVQNVGAYGQEISGVLESVRVLDRSSEKIIELSKDECGFGYRTSIFNTSHKNRYLVLSITYRLRKDVPATVKYPDLMRRFEGRPAPPALSEVRTAVREVRASKGMLIVDGDPDSHSAGSFFKNPILTETEFQRIQSGVSVPVPRYPAGAERVKTSAAWLIEKAGFTKGTSSGRAAISSKHTLALVNRGGASAAEILALGREIRRRVEELFGVRLIAEPVFLGFDEEF